MSVREALTWVKHDNLSNLVLELDSQVVYFALISSYVANPLLVCLLRIVISWQALWKMLVSLWLLFV